ncbi:PREDICTED: uncharacterized protein LOC104803691 [Tarenaya hassleriana]|uniref:uncharacterized protein LOC104803691 n=1 Tax=Tarenaya hassleriana TaxID=28532 RepID=UPI00053C82A5|nr:PREDICTED: uncharacterized protein LOC104803691 [Tarenaya hassleriana]XP_010526009.1 PREDICTED: uncharacterized protein LOC104803691 [Tarenaya hassleriana]
MATTTAVMSSASPRAAMVNTFTQTKKKTDMKISYIRGINSYGGLKAQNKAVSMGMPMSTEQCFANVVTALKGRRGGNGSLSSTCNAVGEIFRIAAIMNGLVLVGVAVGFVLLRIEASVEEAE